MVSFPPRYRVWMVVFHRDTGGGRGYVTTTTAAATTTPPPLPPPPPANNATTAMRTDASEVRLGSELHSRTPRPSRSESPMVIMTARLRVSRALSSRRLSKRVSWVSRSTPVWVGLETVVRARVTVWEGEREATSGEWAVGAAVGSTAAWAGPALQRL